MGRKNKNKYKNKKKEVTTVVKDKQPITSEIMKQPTPPIVKTVEQVVKPVEQPVKPVEPIVKKQEEIEIIEVIGEEKEKKGSVEMQEKVVEQQAKSPVTYQPVNNQIPNQQVKPVQQVPQPVNNQMPNQQVKPVQQVPQPVKKEEPILVQPLVYQQVEATVPKVQQVTEIKKAPIYNPEVKKVDLLITKNPKSSFSEAIKSVRTNLQFASVDKEIKIILVSSPEPGDGKSLISSNLAGAYAQENKKVLIIDCDLRKGRQAEIFGIKKYPTTGYTNLILNYRRNITTLENYINKTGIANVALIPNGPTPPNPIELLSSPKNKELLDDLKTRYDVIILDCPPVLGLSDALVMTKYSDANIIVISKGKTKVESLAEVKKSFEKVNSTITGVITNKAKRKHNSYYGYYGE